MNKVFLSFLLAIVGFTSKAQEKQGDRWVDDNLTFQVVKDEIKTEGIFAFCVLDTSRGTCIENLSSGVEVKVFDAQGEEIWEGIATGRSKDLKLPRALPTGKYLTIKAFKPWVTNKSSGTRIYQKKPIEIKYRIK